MGKTNKQWFKHVSMHITIQQELAELKKLVRIHTRVNYNPSYADVIKFLIKHYKDSLRMEYPLNQGLLVGNKLEKESLSVSIPITPKPCSARFKQDGKTRVSFLLES